MTGRTKAQASSRVQRHDRCQSETRTKRLYKTIKLKKYGSYGRGYLAYGEYILSELNISDNFGAPFVTKLAIANLEYER